jgi:hypothetical protein
MIVKVSVHCTRYATHQLHGRTFQKMIIKKH